MEIFAAVYFLVGLAGASIVYRHPDRFMMLFLSAIIVGSGMLVFGYPIVDEFFVLMLLLGVFLRYSVSRKISVFKVMSKRKISPHGVTFIALIAYFLFQSIRGGIWLEDIRMVRWVVFFLIIGVSYFLTFLL